MLLVSVRPFLNFVGKLVMRDLI